MALFKTNLVIVASQLPPDFVGDPQEFFEALVERMEIQSPAGTNFFVVGDVEPSSNQGPWLKNGDRWYVFSVTEGKYIPINIEDSLHILVIGPDTPDTPAETDPKLWLRTSGTRAIGWYGWDGVIWRSFNSLPASGNTASRPTAPVELEQYFDTDINVLIHWERGAWRTVSGSPGDVKFVAQSKLTDALAANPGWIYLGRDDQSIRGLVLGVASKDAGATPESNFPTDSGISARASGDKVGEETHVLDNDEIPQHTHLTGHASALNSGNTIQLHRVDNAEDIAIPPVVPPNYFEVNGDGSSNGTKNGTAGDGPTGTMTITSRQLTTPAYTAAAAAHENMQPTLFLWALVKT